MGRAAAAALLCCWWCALVADGARVLMLLPTSARSQKAPFLALGAALTGRGHRVVFFSAFRPSVPVPGVEEVVPERLAQHFAEENFPNMFRINSEGLQAGWRQYRALLADGPRAALNSSELHHLLRQRFDVVILGIFGYPFYFVPHVLNAPLILLSPVSYVPFLTSPLGSPTLPALNPSIPFTAGTDRMSFTQRVKNVIGTIWMDTLIRTVYATYSDRLVAEEFGDGVMPRALDIERNASLVLLNSNPAMDYHKPLLPNVIEVGGLHCTAPNELPAEVAAFLGDSEFVLFSLGSVVRPQDMSSEQKAAILAGLGKLPYKVLLKWDTTNRTGLPVNILPSKWLPQQDILGNSKCRMFISHGGFASVVESVCHGVPMVVLPVSSDQQCNAARAARLGIAEVLTWDALSAETLGAAVAAALSGGPRAAVIHRQRLLREQPVPPLQLAVHWVEHVIRHGGAPHLRSVGAELNFFQYYSLDVLAFLLAVLLLTLKLLVVVVRWMLRCCCDWIRTQHINGANAGQDKNKDD
ncbi:UDP-glucuronosyltransferase 1-5 [Amphibalanus amphitrite]|uniref:UDP-glucuronosyltransferase 1-5 n=1 Tax=Amphibalanus amphitrite TaxID=1232801 RepID=A0A6A4W2D4_AMPAM|nr:UDP-glucuronosyltransferase 1-5 [Amphibalanus amphitrite]